jgi:hypothetical protein
MNKRTIELMNEANKVVGFTGNVAELAKVQHLMDKFAELIIRDCAELAASPDSHLFADTAFNKGYFGGRSDAAFVIRAHFGVEE